MNIFYPPKEFSFKYNNWTWTRVNLFKLIPYPLANIIIFLSFRRKKFYKNFPFCQLLYLLHLLVSYFIYSSELIWGLLKNPGSTRGSTRGFANPLGDLQIPRWVQPGDLQIPGLVWGFSLTNPLKIAISVLEKNIDRNFF